MKRQKVIDDRYLDKIVSVAYGDAGILDKLIVYRDAKKNPQVKKLLDEYKATAVEVKDIASKKCPDKLIENTEAQIRKEKTPVKYSIVFQKPVYSSAALAIIIAIAALLIFRQPNQGQKYSKAEVLTAEMQVKQSLGLVGKIFKKTQNTISYDVLDKQVAPPIKKGMNVVNNLLNGG